MRLSQILASAATTIAGVASCNAGLAPLPGTLVVAESIPGGAVWTQYNASTGEVVGTATLTIAPGLPTLQSGAVTSFNGELYAGARPVSSGTYQIGRVNLTTSQIADFLTVNLATRRSIDSDGQFFFGVQSSWRLSRYDHTGVYLSEIALQHPDWNASFLKGVACDGGRFVTVGLAYAGVQFWTESGVFESVRTLDVDAPLWSVEYEAASGRLWTSDWNGEFSRIKMFDPNSSAAAWTATRNGLVSDIAYFPVPSPGLGLLVLSPIACGRMRRRNRSSRKLHSRQPLPPTLPRLAHHLR